MRVNRSNKVLNKALQNNKELRIITKILTNEARCSYIDIESIEEGCNCYIVRYVIEGRMHKIKHIYKDSVDKGVKSLLETFNKHRYTRTIINLSLLSYRAIRTLEWLADDIYYEGGATINFNEFTLENHSFTYQCLVLFEKMELLDIVSNNLPNIEVKFLYKREDILFNIYQTLNDNKCSL